MAKKTKTLFQNLQLELSERLHHREQRDRSRSVDSARREDAAAPPPLLSGGSASVDRRKHGVLLTNGGGSGNNVLLDLMAVPPCNGRPGRSPARSRASEDETADNGGYSKGRRVQVAESSAAQQKRLTSALDSNLNELMVGSCSNAALEAGKPRGSSSRGSRTKSESRAGDREEARRAQQTTTTHNGDAECFLQVGL
jgi:hypothetical protein